MAATPNANHIQTFREMRANGKNYSQISKETGWHRQTVRSWIDREPAIEKPSEQEGFRVDGDTASYSGITTTPIRTEADAIKAAGVDTSIWYVDRWECTQWTVGVKDRENNPVQTQQYRVKLYLKRLFSTSIQKAQEQLFERMKKYAPEFPKAFQSMAKTKADYLAVVGLFDVHFGKFGWGKETGTNYDLKIAESIFEKAVEDLLQTTSNRPVGRWLLPIGNDFFHMDNSRNTTFAGTPLDVDGRYAKVIEAGEMAVVRAIQRMAAKAPVDVVWVPGNHDPTTSYHLARFIWAFFSKCDSVNVDFSPPPRKYYSWGANLIGLTHGNEEKIHELPNLMASEKPEEWLTSKAGSREWLIGHWHQSKKWVTKTTDTSQETVIRALRSLSGVDAWHYRKGYVGTHQAAEVYLYHRKSGYAGHNVVYAR